MKSQEKMNCKEKEALLIIDVQNDYFPGGACELKNAYEAEERIISLISKSRAMGVRLFIFSIRIHRMLIFSLKVPWGVRFLNVLSQIARIR